MNFICMTSRMTARTKRLLLVTGLAGLFVLVLLRTSMTDRTAYPAVENQIAGTSGRAPLRSSPVVSGLTNAGFQAWGKVFMLRIASDHLSRVPLSAYRDPFGLSTFTSRAALADFYLETLDRRHAIFFFQGVVNKAMALNVEMAEVFRKPSVFEHLGDNTGAMVGGAGQAGPLSRW